MGNSLTIEHFDFFSTKERGKAPPQQRRLWGGGATTRLAVGLRRGGSRRLGVERAVGGNNSIQNVSPLGNTVFVSSIFVWLKEGGHFMVALSLWRSFSESLGGTHLFCSQVWSLNSTFPLLHYKSFRPFHAQWAQAESPGWWRRCRSFSSRHWFWRFSSRILSPPFSFVWVYDRP